MGAPQEFVVTKTFIFNSLFMGLNKTYYDMNEGQETAEGD
jgi:hypothetical protein